MKNTIKITLFIAFALFLFACGNNANKGGAKIDYQTGFPQETSPALTDFMTDYFMQRWYPLFNTDEGDYVYTETNDDHEMKAIHYFKTNVEDMETFYLPVQEENEPAQAMNQLYSKVDELQQPIQDPFSLPTVTLSEDNSLLITSGGDEDHFSLPELEKSIKEADPLLLNIMQVNEDGFILRIDKETTDEEFYLFVLNDLSKAAVFEQSHLEQAVNQGELAPFYPLLKNEKSDPYGQLLYNSFVDTEANELLYIEEKHEISRDGQYIYLNGAKNPLDEDAQRIQRVEDYLAGNDEVHLEFHLNYKDIAKHADFKASGNVSIGSVVYFSEDFIVLFINYTAPITGKAGSTNVLIDLQDEENQTVYVVELGIR